MRLIRKYILTILIFAQLCMPAQAMESQTVQHNIDCRLHDASYKGDAKTVLDLLKNGMNPNLLDVYGWTALHKASLYGYAEIVLLLLEYGANPNLQDPCTLRTALHRASCKGYTMIVRLLLEYGANPNLLDVYGWTALHFAFCNRYIGHVAFILRKRDDPGLRGLMQINRIEDIANSDMPYEDEASSSAGYSPEMVHVLLKYGADPLQESNGKTILDYAKFRGQDDSGVKALLAYSILPAQRQGTLHALMQKSQGYNAELDNLYQSRGEQGILGLWYKTVGITNNKQLNIFEALRNRELGMHKR